MLRKNLIGLMAATLVGIGSSAVQAKELAFAVFVPATSPTVTKIYEPWVKWFNEKTAGDDVSIKLLLLVLFI